jgi:RNA-directed DNA polymerase
VNAVKPANDTKVKDQELQDKLYLAAKENPKRRFHALYDKIYGEEILLDAWRRVNGNKGSGEIAGITIAQSCILLNILHPCILLEPILA